jgi:hypothetical protein
MARRWLVAAVLLLALGGCGDEPAAEPATVPVPATSVADPVPSRPAATVGTTPKTAEPKTAAPEAAAQAAGPGAAGFAAAVQRELPELVLDHRDEEIVALAEQTCAALAAGRSAGAVVAGVRTFGTDRAHARQLVKLAIGTVCPDQDRRIGEF